MRLVFVGIAPGEHLLETLRSNGVETSSAKTLPQDACDAIIYHPASPSAGQELSELRNRFPSAWCALVAKPEWFQQAPFLQACAELHADALWSLPSWEIQLGLTLKKVLGQLAHQQHLIDIEKEYERLRDEYEEISSKATQLITQFEKDVALASNIQRSLLPKKTPQIPDIRLVTKYKPAAGFGGDYYDIFEFGDKKRYGFLMADSKTHGMAAALLTVLIKIRLEEMKDRFPDSKSFVEHLNTEIQHVHKKEMNSLSLFYGILDRSSLSFQYTSAGALTPLLWRLGEATPLSTAANPALGEANDFSFRESFISLKPGDLLLLHTDGLEGVLGAESTKTSLASILSEADPAPDPQEIQNEILGKVDRHLEGATLKDDITLIQILVEGRALYVASESK
ncbi:MAG: SpoIIE family protein phosphatase [Bdellovibrionales bacterium]|nr:SpoIIE family protein phosphatase [Bdellovibrionales bacterium]